MVMSLNNKERGVAGKRFADLLRDPGFKVGSYHGEFISPSVGQLALAANCDFVMIDMEHSGFGFETLKTALRHVHDAGLPSLVRTPGKDYHFIARCATWVHKASCRR